MVWAASTVIALGAGAAAVGGAALSANAAGNAADAQERGANQANATSRYQYDQTRKDNAPFLANGTAASNALAYRLGLGGTAKGGASATDYSAAPTSTFAGQSGNPLWDKIIGGFQANHQAQYGSAFNRDWNADAEAMQTKAALDAAYKNQLATDPEMQALMAGQAQQQTQNEADPQFGSLLKKFGQDDLNNDLVYQNGLQFGLDQGVQGLNRQAAASGSLLSGAAAKALTKFGNDYATTKGNESFNRFQVQRDGTFNKLAGLSGVGQVASNQVGSAGQSMANQVSQNQVGMGNARGASGIAQGNAWSGAGTSMVNNYQQSNMVDAYNKRTAAMNGNALSGYGVPQQPGVYDWNSQG